MPGTASVEGDGAAGFGEGFIGGSDTGVGVELSVSLSL